MKEKLIDYLDNHPSLLTDYATLSAELDGSPKTIKKLLNQLDDNNLYKTIRKPLLNKILIISYTQLYRLPLANPTTKDKKLAAKLFPINYTIPDKQRTKAGMNAYKAEYVLLSRKEQQDNLLFMQAEEQHNSYNYNETFAKLDNPEETYLVYLASRIYDTYAIAFDKMYYDWFLEDKAHGIYSGSDASRGQGKIYHKETFQSLKIPYLGTRTYQLAKKLLDTTRLYKVSVPAYIYAIMSRYAWRSSHTKAKAYVPSLEQMTDEKHTNLFKKIMNQREYAWVKTNKDLPYSDLGNTGVMVAISAYRNFLTNKPQLSEPMFSIDNNSSNRAYQNYYYDTLRQINDLHLPPTYHYWATYYLNTMVGLAMGTLSHVNYRANLVLNYLINKTSGIKETYNQWVAEDNGDAVNASQDLFTFLGKDLELLPELKQEQYESLILDSLDDFYAVIDNYNNGSVNDLVFLELTRANHSAKIDLPGLIRVLTPVMLLTQSGLIDRTKIKELYGD